MAKNNRFIQKAIKPTNKGKLRKQLLIPKRKLIPVTLLDKIIDAKPGQTIKNPTLIGKKRIKVTRKLERRAILARNLKGIPKR